MGIKHLKFRALELELELGADRKIKRGHTKQLNGRVKDQSFFFCGK